MSTDLPAVASGLPAAREPSPARLDSSVLPIGRELAEDITTAELLARSGLFPDTRTKEECFAKIRAGRELGIGPVTALRCLHVIKGKVGLDYTLIGGLIRKSGIYDYRVIELSDEAASIDFWRGDDCLGTSTYTIKDAEAAGALNANPAMSPWYKSRRNMLMARALSNGAKWYCPDVLMGGVYTVEELTEPVAYISEPTRPAITDRNAELRSMFAAEAEWAKRFGIEFEPLPDACADEEIIRRGLALHAQVETWRSREAGP